MDDDFNTPSALAALFGLTTEINRLAASNASEAGPDAAAALEAARGQLRALLGVLGLELPDAATAAGDLTAPLVQFLLELRQQARAAKDFAASDAIRDRLHQIGVIVEDRPEGATWRLG
jgi:cysteinyl-tRNA synthetase